MHAFRNHHTTQTSLSLFLRGIVEYCSEMDRMNGMMNGMMKNKLNVRGTSLSSQQSMVVVQTQSTSDDMKVIQQILAAHSPDAHFNIVNEQAHLNMAQDILNKANRTFPPLDPQTDPKVSEEGITEELVLTIRKIGCELSCNCSSGEDMKVLTAAVFHKLEKYSWEDKLVIALLAFAINYGEFCLPSQLNDTNPLAKYLVQFKPLLDISGQEILISNLLKVIIAMAKSIIKLNELHSRHPQYISQDKYPFSQAEISVDVYWAIKGIVACSSQTTGIMNMGKQYRGMITEAFMKVIQILENRHQKLKDIWDQCSKVIQEKENEEAYYNLKEFMKRIHTDNVEVLMKLIHTEDNTVNTPLFHRDANKKESLNVLQSKTVILFYSYYDVPDEEIKEIEQQAWKTDKRPYEIVWLPILYRPDLSDEIKKVIDQKARLMPWYSLHYSLTLHPCVIKYIKKHWEFEKKPLLVAINEQGNVNSCNVYDMIMTWGSRAYPFDPHTEGNLWITLNWRLGFFIDEELVKEGKLIYLYGGDDLGWIEKFISTMKKVVKGEMIKLIYVGKKHRETIKNGNLSECWDDQKIMRFWARMNSIFNYKMKSVVSIDNDKTFKDVRTLLGSMGSRNGWAIIGHGSDNMDALNGETITQLLVQLDKLDKVPITIEDFFIELGKFKPIPATHCSHIDVTGTNGIIQENMICPVCSCPMEKQVLFTCCKNV